MAWDGGPVDANTRYRREVKLPIRPDKIFVLIGTFPMSRLDWIQFQALLAAMEPGLVESDSAAQEDRG